jgi:excisionase family DNA binding protein
MPGLTKRLYRPDEVAEMLNVSKRTVYRMVRRGELKKDPRRNLVRIPATAVREFLRGKERPDA